MELITLKIDNNLKNLIKHKFSLLKEVIEKENKRINHINIYHREWQKNDCDEIIEILKNDYSINIKNIISLGFISAQVNCLNQHFHIDYNGTTETYFIPLIDLNDLNGTEYVKFNDTNFNINIIDKLIDITNNFENRKEVEEEFRKMGISNSDYKFCFLNAPKWSMTLLPYYVFHRGQSNKGTKNRTLFQIVVAINSNAIVSDKSVIIDSELDEESPTINKLLYKRAALNKSIAYKDNEFKKK
jgi:hypothetical protein